MAECSISWCLEEAKLRGMCAYHYKVNWHKRDPEQCHPRPLCVRGDHLRLEATITNRGLTCSVSWCTRPALSLGLCNSHYVRQRSDHDLEKPFGRLSTLPLEDLFWKNVDTSGECWHWLGRIGAYGYGILWYEGRVWIASRIAYELQIGPVPSNLLVCHHCDNPPCVRGSHLFLGTQADNMRDMVEKERNRRQNPLFCPHGHPRTVENSRVTPNGRALQCQVCRRLSSKRLRLSRINAYVQKERSDA